MPGALDALKKYAFGKKEPEDIELPLPEGHKRDPRLPKESTTRAGFRLMQETLKGKK
jgi:hypothetical protein